MQDQSRLAHTETWSEVLRHRPFWRRSLVAISIRLTPFMTALGFVAAIGTIDSEAVGGSMVAAYVLANVIAPLNGRIHCRFGPD